MKYLSDEWLYFLADSQNRTCSWVNGTVVKNAIPTPLRQKPMGWKEIEPHWGTNIKYWSAVRSFSTKLTFINDGASIIRWYNYLGENTEEELYILILKWNRTNGIYELEYRGKIDFAKAKNDPYVGITVNTLEGGPLRYLNANESKTYEIPCDSRNPEAIKTVFDGTSLVARYNYSCPDVKIQEFAYAVPLTFVSSTGDSVDVIHGTQSFESFSGNAEDYVADSKNYFFSANTDTRLKGIVNLRVYNIETVRSVVSISIFKNNGVRFQIFDGIIPPAPVYNQPNVFALSVPIDIHLENGESVFFIFQQVFEKNVTNFANTEIVVDFSTKKIPSTSFALRPLTILKNLVEKMSNGLCTAESKFLEKNNRIVATCGDALKNIDIVNAGIDGYNLKTSFSDWWSFYNPLYNLGMKIVGNVIWIEPKSDIYKPDQSILKLGEASDFTIETAEELLFNSIKCGYPNQTYNGLTQNDGKLEFNAGQEWSTILTSINKVYDLTSKWNAGCYIIEFIRAVITTDSKYNESDNGVYAIEISDEQEALTTSINTAISVNIVSSPTVPIIISPVANEIINNNKPTIRGKGIPGSKVGFKVDTVYDGFTSVDSNGEWAYEIQTALSSYEVNGLGIITSTGEHTISAGFADSTGNLSLITPLASISIIIYSRIPAFVVTSPNDKDFLYNNMPIIKGIAPAGALIEIGLDGMYSGFATADGSCKWEYEIPFPQSDRDHSISVTCNNVTIIKTVTISSNNLSYPLITNIASNSTICDNTPLIKGVAKPGENVTLYVDFAKVDSSGNPTNLGTVIADANGNWSYQVTLYQGAPLTDGIHYISTSSENQYVDITVKGYKLFRENYSLIEGVNDNSVYNVNLRPRNQILGHSNVLKSILYQHPESKITLDSATKNRNLVTVLNGVRTKENDNISVGGLGDPLFLPFYFNFITKVPFSFEKIMQSIQTGYIEFIVKGYPLYALPIGEMSCKPVMEESQSFKLLAAPNNSLSTFLLLSESVLFIQDYNKNMLVISNKNPLQFYKYGNVINPKYHHSDVNDASFNERHTSFITRPFYFQPWQNTDTISLQFITAGLGALTVKMFNSDGNEVNSWNMDISINSIVKNPYSLQMLSISLATVNEGNYNFLVMADDIILAESEWVSIFESCPGTVLIEYSSSYNMLDGYFDTWNPMIRVAGTIFPEIVDSESTDYEDERKNVELLHAIPYKTYPFVIGKPNGIPDWMQGKINEITLLNRCNIEGIHFTRDPQSKKFEKIELNGSPLSCYKTSLIKGDNNSSLIISDTPISTSIGGVIATVDGEAFGQAGNVIQIAIEKE